MLSIPARIVVYDPSTLQCELLTAGLESLRLGFVVQCATDFESIVLALSKNPDAVVVISDAAAGNGSFTIARELRTQFAGLPFVFLLAEGRIDRTIEAFRAGARGIVYHSDSLSQLANCISRVHQGEVCVRGVDLGLILDGLLKPSLRVTDVSGRTLLSPREDEISRLVAEGMSNREVAQSLKISQSTVKNSLFHVFEKLGISNRVELARYVSGVPEPEGRALQ